MILPQNYFETKKYNCGKLNLDFKKILLYNKNNNEKTIFDIYRLSTKDPLQGGPFIFLKINKINKNNKVNGPPERGLFKKWGIKS